MSRISIIGTGYVGLVTGACLADRGHEVVCVDTDVARVEAARRARPLIHEAGLEAILERTIGHGLEIDTDLAAAVRATEVTFICVGTPSSEDGIDLSFVTDAAAQIGRALGDKPGFHVVVVKSTVVPGSTDVAVREALERGSGKIVGDTVGLGVNPEFLTEGRAVEDFTEPDRIVLGASDPRTEAVMREIYADFDDTPVLVCSLRDAEMIKYASNALLATMISFSNEIANLGAAIGGVDTVEVMRGVHASRYLTTPTADGPVTADLAAFLFAGCGFGGSCLPKDTRALVAKGRSLGVPMRVLEAVLAVNGAQPSVLVDLVRDGLGGLAGTSVGVLGLAFKPDTNDTRESPAFPVIRQLAAGGARVLAHDPIVSADELPADVADLADLRRDLDALVIEVDALVIITSWADYAALPSRVAGLDEPPLVVDGRRMLDPVALPRYAGIGR